MLRETHNKIVASFVDIGSICLAYQVGVSHFGVWAGLGYGMFDAWIVVWQRDRISNFIHRTNQVIRQVMTLKRKY